ncbi:MAG TPA: lamin tail domain-containing protein [Luteolibacter sp.]|nr:lamin tail domain-containing protein [Luteolibacter sp.]
MKSHPIPYVRRLLTSLAVIGLSLPAIAQDELLNETLRDGALPGGWSQVGVTFQTAAGGYARLETIDAILTSPSVDASTYTSVTVNFAVAKFSTGGDGPITLEYSLNGGTDWQTAGDSPTPTDANYLNASIDIESVSADFLVRFNRAGSPSQKRLRDVVVVGNSVDTTDPVIVSLNPENGFPAALTNTALVINYDEAVVAGTTGALTLRRTDDDSIVETVTLPSAQVSSSGAAGVVKLTATLDAGTSYYVDVDAGFFTDASANPAPEISGSTEWSFTTRTASSVIISQYYEGDFQDRYIELKNLTGNDIPLDGYSVAAWPNADNQAWKTGAGTTDRITDLTGETIPANGTFLIANINAAAPAYAVANNDLSVDGGCTAIDGNDSVVLYFSGVDPLGFTLAEVVDAVSFVGSEGTDISFHRLADGPGFDFAPGSSILDYSSVWATKTNAEVDAALDTDEWYLKASQSIEILTLSLSPSSVAESAGPAASEATVTRSGSTSGAVFVTIESSNPSAAADEGLAGFVEIPDGQASATFNIDVTDNPWLFGDAIVTFTVTATGYLPDSADLTLTDDLTDAPFPVVINEVDADQESTDSNEFVELYNSSGSEVFLDGLVLVFFNGGQINDPSYATIDLSGFSIPANGFFVIGSATVPNVDLIAWGNNGIQNGPDGIGLYLGSAANFPNGTSPAGAPGVLIDALVYNVGATVDADLVNALTPGQSQVNENENGNSFTQSMSRVPDGGAAFNTSLYVAQTATPGATNILPDDDFAAWIAGFEVGGLTGFGDDSDNDGLANALENILGSDPSAANQGINLVSASGGDLVFQHTLNATPASDLDAVYEWSTDLATWYADGASDGGTTVTFGAPVEIAPGPPALVEVTASITGTPPAKVFARLKVTQVP